MCAPYQHFTSGCPEQLMPQAINKGQGGIAGVNWGSQPSTFLFIDGGLVLNSGRIDACGPRVPQALTVQLSCVVLSNALQHALHHSFHQASLAYYCIPANGVNVSTVFENIRGLWECFDAACWLSHPDDLP